MSAPPENPDSPPLSLSADPPRRTGLQFDLPHYAALYNSSVDTVKRWRRIAREKNAPIPLDDPLALADWWAANMVHRVPDGILAAAERARSSAPKHPAPLPVEHSPTSEPPKSDPVKPESPTVDITDLILADYEEVRQASAAVLGSFQLYQKALAGLGGDVTRTQRAWQENVKSLRFARTSAKDHALKTRELLPKSGVLHDLALLSDMIRQLDESEERRVLERCPSLTPDMRAEVARALQAVAAAKQRVFRNLTSVTPDDFRLEEAAA